MHWHETEALVFLTDWRRCQVFDALVRGVTPWSWPSGNLHDRLLRVFSETLSARRLEREACVKLNLTPGAYGVEYSADVFGKIACCIFENGVSVPSQGKRTLRVAGDGKIGVIE